MNDWGKYKADEVLTGTDANGNRLISAFAKDYKRVFNQDICPTCKDFKDKFQKFLKKIQDMSNSDKKNTGFVLKKMYENIPLKFGSAIYVNNQNLTDDYAKELINNHPRGKELFDIIPENVNTGKDEDLPEAVIQLIEENNKKELIELAEGLGIEDAKGNETELAKLIVARQVANSTGV